jgi:hypothetical protein
MVRWRCAELTGNNHDESGEFAVRRAMIRAAMIASRYSITSSARMRIEVGKLTPSALAVFRVQHHVKARMPLNRQIGGFPALQDIGGHRNDRHRRLGRLCRAAHGKDCRRTKSVTLLQSVGRFSQRRNPQLGAQCRTALR